MPCITSGCASRTGNRLFNRDKLNVFDLGYLQTQKAEILIEFLNSVFNALCLCLPLLFWIHDYTSDLLIQSSLCQTASEFCLHRWLLKPTVLGQRKT